MSIEKEDRTGKPREDLTTELKRPLGRKLRDTKDLIGNQEEEEGLEKQEEKGVDELRKAGIKIIKPTSTRDRKADAYSHYKNLPGSEYPTEEELVAEEEETITKDREDLFKEFKDKQNEKLATIKSDINLYDLYFKNQTALEDLKNYLLLKGKEQYQKDKIDKTSVDLKKGQKVEWHKARQKLSEEIVKQGINQQKFPRSEWDRPETSAVLVKKFNLDLLDKQDRNILLQVVVDIIDTQPQLGRGVAVKYAKAEQKQGHKERKKAQELETEAA